MRGMKDVKAVFFDAGNTLIFPNYRLISDEFMARGVEVTAEQLFKLDCELRDHYNHLAASGEETEHLWRHYWVTLLRRAGLREALRAEVIKELTWRNERGYFWLQVLAGTAEVLAQLRGTGRLLGIVSNSEGRLESFLQHVGLRRYFDFVLDSAIVGVEKPDPAIFRMALERARVQPGEALFVGDNYSVDIVAAQKVGIPALLFNPHGSQGGLDCVVIKELSDILTLLD